MRSLKSIILCIVCNASAGALALAATNLVPPPMSRAQAEIYGRVTSRILAPCCWSQAVQIHQSEAAEKVRAEVFAYIRQGASEDEIFNWLAAEYGERILGEPRGVRGKIAFLTPLAALLTGLAIVVYALSRLVKPQPQLTTYTGLLPDLPEANL
jgi:cytochrome c-type biogenesis protein CcmH